MQKVANINDYNTQEARDLAFHKASYYKKNGRTYDEIYKHCLQGDLVEYAICGSLGLEKASDEISEYDATWNGKKVEIKSHTKDETWWNIKPYRYDHFLKNCKDLDLIINAFLDTETGDVYIKAIADAPSFPDYLVNSKFENGYPYYNMKAASKCGDCNIL